MTSLAMTLIGWTCVWFFGLGVAGFSKPRCALWRWIDLGYYPLGALTAILVILALDRNIVADRLLAREQALHREWQSHPIVTPSFEPPPVSAELIDVSVDGLRTIKQQALLCLYAGKYACTAYPPLAQEVGSAYDGLVRPTNAHEPAQLARYAFDYCHSSERMISRLDNRRDLLDGGAFHALRGSFARHMLTHNSEQDALADLDATIQRSQAQNRTLLAAAGTNDDLTKELFRNYAEFASLTLRMTYFCSELPQEDETKLVQLEQSASVQKSRAIADADINRQVIMARKANAKTRAQRVSSFVHEDLWPFLLTLAAALKFGKAIAGLRKKGGHSPQHTHCSL